MSFPSILATAMMVSSATEIYDVIGAASGLGDDGESHACFGIVHGLVSLDEAAGLAGARGGQARRHTIVVIDGEIRGINH